MGEINMGEGNKDVSLSEEALLELQRRTQEIASGAIISEKNTPKNGKNILRSGEEVRAIAEEFIKKNKNNEGSLKEGSLEELREWTQETAGTVLEGVQNAKSRKEILLDPGEENDEIRRYHRAGAIEDITQKIVEKRKTA